jgi:hypothetical protein
MHVVTKVACLCGLIATFLSLAQEKEVAITEER